MYHNKENSDSDQETSKDKVLNIYLPRKSKRKQNFVQESICHEIRQSRRKGINSSELICPVCSLTLRDGDYVAHFNYEWNKLAKSLSCAEMRNNLLRCAGSGLMMSSFSDDAATSSQWTHGHDTHLFLDNRPAPLSQETQRENRFSSSTRNESQPEDLSMQDDTDKDSPSAFAFPENPSTSYSGNHSTIAKHSKIKKHENESFKRVKINRLLRAQSKRWEIKGMEDEAICPVCQDSVFAQTLEELQNHVQKCLRKQQGDDSSDDEIDVEGDEYEWCGMKKIRLTSLLKSQGQLDALGTLVEKGNEDANVEICLVDEDGDGDYGSSQYNQNDLTIPLDVYKNDGSENVIEEHIPDDMDSYGNDEDVEEVMEIQGSQQRVAMSSSGPLIEALQNKIRDLEDRGNFICHICHGPYTVPLTSIVCWHVHCEKCWLQALSSQKLCPQCKVIVSPTELRRIYL